MRKYVISALTGLALLTASGISRSEVTFGITLGVPYESAPVYYAPPVVYYSPAPVYYAPRAGYYRQHGYYGRRDRDGDGIPNYRDRDRDGDGVRNSRDRAPDNPRRY